jgi:eukaryotic-like serine/threonine-protein kinase
MPSVPHPRELKFGPYAVDLRAGELRKNGTRIRLQEKPLRVLALLAERHGDLVTREELKRHLWPEETFVDFETGLNTAVKKLRGALSDDAENPRFIETIPRRGYRFIHPLETVPQNGNGTAPVPSLTVGESVPVPNPPPAIPAPAEKKGLKLSVILTIAFVPLALGALVVWFFQGRSALSFNSRDMVLIADFENQTGDPRFDKALDTAFAVSVSQSRYVNIFPRVGVESVLRRMEKPPDKRITPSLGREICQRENIRGLITASITRTGQEFAITAELIDPHSGQPVRSYTERAHGEDQILDSLDLLAREMREALGESLYRIHQNSKQLPQVTTRSVDALQMYSEGSSLWHNGKYQDAVVQFKASIASDPDFAMAHAALGRAYYSFLFNQPGDGQKEYEKALSLLSRTTDREHMLIETNYQVDRKHLGEANGLMRAYLNRYPDDAEMRFDYGNLLRARGRERDGIEQYKLALQVLPDFGHAYIGIATAYKQLGDYSSALDAYSKAFALNPQWIDSGNISREYGFALVAAGQPEKAEQVFTSLLSKPATRENGLRSMVFLDLYRGRYRSAQSRLQQSMEILKTQLLPLSLARVYLLSAIVADGRQDHEGVRQNLDAAFSKFNDIQSKVVFGAILGDAYARAGAMEQAQKVADLIAPLADKLNSEQTGYLHLLQGEIALAGGKQQEAIELLNQADKENSTGYSLEAIAHAYQQAGDLDKAIPAYESMFRSVDRSLGWEPQQRWLEARYTLAQDYSARGDNQKARDTLGVLLNLWKDADPDLPLLKQAKAESMRLH